MEILRHAGHGFQVLRSVGLLVGRRRRPRSPRRRRRRRRRRWRLRGGVWHGNALRDSWEAMKLWGFWKTTCVGLCSIFEVRCLSSTTRVVRSFAYCKRSSHHTPCCHCSGFPTLSCLALERWRQNGFRQVCQWVFDRHEKYHGTYWKDFQKTFQRKKNWFFFHGNIKNWYQLDPLEETFQRESFSLLAPGAAAWFIDSMASSGERNSRGEEVIQQHEKWKISEKIDDKQQFWR